ncbi:hypothetical protein P152DRAFT_457678 [Eremomyces bilateralis CBS 781.70]|uniref:CENP-V/GFA domain-containing protein n=1 Tax=Eremomyces bilateralis CBS 781.70 TaxID=1392243 RepID=A0A6G1G5M2_9PEZI|nr:uncharacterized protein P152DRAFT_457678 [Eremomyces bilateralis CBS 781.70]KAF1813318.1 hypothetical protein P152DRAFT_457678 [Eremomyces bilateralis CBS 781.70]
MESEKRDDKLPSNPPTVTGGCRCGLIRYIASAIPTKQTYCHCHTCRKLSGSAFMAFVDFPVDSVLITTETSSDWPRFTDWKAKHAELPSLRTIKVSPYATRTCCGACGSPISMVYVNAPEVIGITAGTVDDKCDMAKFGLESQHIFMKEKSEWYQMPEDGFPTQWEMEGVDKLLSK